MSNVRPWAQKEMQKLSDLAKAGLTDTEIGGRLGRTKNAVATMRRAVGIKRFSPFRWDDEAEVELKKAWTFGVSVKEMARHFGVGEHTIRSKAQHLKLPRRLMRWEEQGDCSTCGVGADHIATCPVPRCPHGCVTVEPLEPVVIRSSGDFV